MAVYGAVINDSRVEFSTPDDREKAMVLHVRAECASSPHTAGDCYRQIYATFYERDVNSDDAFQDKVDELMALGW